MRALIILPASMLVGCILVPPKHHRHDHRCSHSHGSDWGGWDDEDGGGWQGGSGEDGEANDRGLREGLWRFELSEPDLHGDCSAVDLGGTTEAVVEVELLREGSELVFLTEFGNLYGEQLGPEVTATGTAEWEGAPIQLELEAEAAEEVALDGLVLGWSGPCLVAAQAVGSFVGELP